MNKAIKYNKRSRHSKVTKKNHKEMIVELFFGMYVSSMVTFVFVLEWMWCM